MNHYLYEKQKALDFYRNLKPVFCNALNTSVYFTRSGFNHILWKNQTFRPEKDQIRGFKLLKYAPNIISKGVIVGHKLLGGLDYWTLIHGDIKVIIRKGSREPLHFFSVMNI